MMETFRQMVNDCLRIGLANDVSTLKKLSKLCYPLAAWAGLPTITLTKKETRGTSSLCPRCGERLQVGTPKRIRYCPKCKHEMDRDVVAVMNIACKGRLRLERPQGLAYEAMKGNTTTPAILRVDAGKLTFRREPIS